MNRKFIYTNYFIKRWKNLGLSDKDIIRLEEAIRADPSIGDIIQGTHGLRKMRFALKCTGKRSGSRVCYVDIIKKETVYVLDIYTKNEKTDLSKEEIKILNKIILELKGE